jgi:hypothetical protein
MKIPLVGAFNAQIDPYSQVESLTFSANSDFIGFCVLWRLHIVGNSGTFWIALHSIEKYIKARLLQIDDKHDIKKYRHDLVELWQSLCEIDSFTDIANPLIYNDFIKDTNNINMEVRYSETGSILSTQFFCLYCLFCTALRFRIVLNANNMSKENYWLGQIGLENALPEYCDDNRFTARDMILDCLDNIFKNNLSWNYLGKLVLLRYDKNLETY